MDMPSICNESDDHKKSRLSTKKLIKQLSQCSVDDGDSENEKLLRLGFERLVKGHEEFSLVLAFIGKYEEEESNIPTTNDIEQEETQTLLDYIWKTTYCDTIRQTCDRFKDDEYPEKRRSLAAVCCRVAGQVFQSETSDDILKKYTDHVDDVTCAGKAFVSDEHFLHGAITLYGSAKLHKLKHTGDISVHGIQNCTWLFTFAVEGLMQDDSLSRMVIRCIIPLMFDMVRYVRSIRSSSQKLRIESEAWCLVRAGLCHHYAGDNEKCAKLCESAMDLIDSKFKRNVTNHQVYGVCLNNAGTAYDRLGDSKRASECYKLASEAYDKVRDWTNQKQKMTILEILKYNIELQQKVPNDESEYAATASEIPAAGSKLGSPVETKV